jgi:hypothetical protein
MTERTPEQIERDIEQARQRLGSTVDRIVTRVHPANVAQRVLDSAKELVFEPDGSLRIARVAVAGSLVVAWVGRKLWKSGS